MEFWEKGAKHVLSVIVSHVLLVARICFFRCFQLPSLTPVTNFYDVNVV